MNKKRKGIVLNLLGVFFILVGIFSMINTIYQGNPEVVLWFCYIGLLIIGFSILFRKSDLLISQISILLIPLGLWTIDFLYFLINSKSLLGIVDYFFVTDSIISRIISLQHLITIPLSLYGLYLMKDLIKANKNKKIGFLKIIFFSFVYMTLLFLITKALTPKNINCVYESCFSFSLPFYYPVVWFVSALLMIVLSNILLKIFVENNFDD